MQDAQAYSYLLNVLAPEHCDPDTLDAKDPLENAELVLNHAERMNCKQYLTAEEIVEGSPTLNLAFVAQIFHERFVWSYIHSKNSYLWTNKLVNVNGKKKRRIVFKQ